MNEEQFNALLEFIDARIAEKIADDAGREAFCEYAWANTCRDRLRELLVTAPADAAQKPLEHHPA